MTEHGFPCRLVLLRHGRSEWNAAGVFTGWEDAYLTAQGELEAAEPSCSSWAPWVTPG